jgi:hypothetical protein
MEISCNTNVILILNYYSKYKLLKDICILFLLPFIIHVVYFVLPFTALPSVLCQRMQFMCIWEGESHVEVGTA